MMSFIELISDKKLPEWFWYPDYFKELVECGISTLPPWEYFNAEDALDRLAGLSKRYPERKIFPFARRVDCDDVACWDASPDYSVIVIHDYASSGWENRANYSSFWEWQESAILQMREYCNC